MQRSGDHVCIATLGSQPQVVTLALDALLARQLPIRELIVVHLSPQNPRYRSALESLGHEFANDRYGERSCRYRLQPVIAGADIAVELQSEAETDAAINTFHALIQDLKRSGATIHLCISGGRRPLGMLALSAALLYFDHADRIWHLFSSDAVRAESADGAQLHLSGHPDVRLVRVPIPPWGQYFPALRTTPDADAATAREQQTRSIDAGELARCRQVFAQLTARQREVLRALAQDRTPQEIAGDLAISLATVNAHKTAIIQECIVAWSMAEGSRLGYDWLRRKFTPFLDEL